MKKILALFIGLLLFQSTLLSQSQTNSFKISEDFTMVIKGSSNVHDWESTINTLEGDGEIIKAENGTLQISACEVRIPVVSIKSSKGNRMDKKMMKAFNEEEYPTIEYVLTSLEKVAYKENDFTAEATGDLTIAGTKKSVKMNISGSALDNGSITIKGSKDMKMTDFNIKPPTALLGTMRTKDEITIEFSIEFIQK